MDLRMANELAVSLKTDIHTLFNARNNSGNESANNDELNNESNNESDDLLESSNTYKLLTQILKEEESLRTKSKPIDMECSPDIEEYSPDHIKALRCIV